MKLEQRINAFVQLGKTMNSLGNSRTWPGFEIGIGEAEYESLNQVIERAHHHNGWFTETNVRNAFRAWGNSLTEEKIGEWLKPYDNEWKEKGARVGVIMAGNIPLVGFHDLLCVVVSGNIAVAKLSSDDKLLMSAVIEMVKTIEPAFSDKIEVKENRLEEVDAIIATGSNNTARYFEYYFEDKPRIIRKNRNSVAVLDGTESREQLEKLGTDIFAYFGLGCRNVSKIFIPADYKLDTFFEGIYDHHDVVNHNKYANNYDYHKTIWLMNREPILDNGFLILRENDRELSSPLGSLYYSRYTDKKEVEKLLLDRADEIQCVVGNDHIPFGQAQQPELWDYADGVDTLKFLASLPVEMKF